jgi:predicted NBD/HSP70 family sugar kinase
MQQYRKVDKLQIAQANKYNVFRCLIRSEPINRAAIAKLTNLSIPTIMSIVDSLIEKKLVRSMGKGQSSGGKPPEMLELIPDRFFYIGLDVGGKTIRVVENNMKVEQIAYLYESTGQYLPAEAFVRHLQNLILTIFNQLKVEEEQILGVCIAMPGLIELESGNVLFSPDFGWENVPLRAWLQGALPFPVIIENANRALALNESHFLPDEDSGHTTFSVNLAHGIGAGLVLGDELYTGASGTSGEIGHITVDHDGPVCQCGNIGCLEAIASGGAIARDARQAFREGKSPILASLCGENAETIEAKLVFQAAEQGDEASLQIIDKAAEYIGVGISMAINVFDPDRIVLCGGLMKNGPSFFEKIKTSIEKHKMRQAGRKVVISAGTKDDYSTANGACRVLANTLWRQRILPI